MNKAGFSTRWFDPLRRSRRCISRATVLGGWIAFVISLLATFAHAQEYRPSLVTNPDSALVVTLEQIGGDPITLAFAVSRALDHSTMAGEAQASLDAAEAVVRREKGIFDPELFAEVDHAGRDRPTASPFAGADVLEETETSSTAGARLRFRYGTELEATLETTRLETNSTFAALDPEFRSFGRIQVRQPILKGFGPSARRQLSAAERNYQAALAGYRDAVLEVRALVETVYWELYATERDYAVALLIVDRAEALLAQAQLRAGAGLVGPNEVANARVFLAEQQLSSLDTEERLDQVSDELSSLLGLRPASGVSRFRPADGPPSEFSVREEEALVERAFSQNHELQSARSQLEALEAEARGAKWDALPTLDLIGSLGGNGLSGTGQDVIFGTDTLRIAVDGGFSDAFSQVRSRDFPTWSVGVRFSLPLGMREGGGERDRLRAEVMRARHQVEAIRRSLEEEVRSRHRELRHGSRRLAVARDGVDASFEQVRIGLIEYDNGRTTAFELVRLGSDLAAAQRRFSEALVRTAKAAAELRHLTSEGFPETVFLEEK